MWSTTIELYTFLFEFIYITFLYLSFSLCIPHCAPVEAIKKTAIKMHLLHLHNEISMNYFGRFLSGWLCERYALLEIVFSLLNFCDKKESDRSSNYSFARSPFRFFSASKHENKSFFRVWEFFWNSFYYVLNSHEMCDILADGASIEKLLVKIIVRMIICAAFFSGC